MSQRRKVAGRTQRTLLRYDRMHALVQHLDHHLNQNGANAGYANTQCVCTQQKHTTDHILCKRLSRGGTMAEDQVGRQLVAHFIADGHTLKIAKTCGNTIGYPSFIRNLLCQSAGLFHSLQSGICQFNRSAITGHSNKAFQGKTMPIQHNVLNFLWVVHDDNVSFLDP